MDVLQQFYLQLSANGMPLGIDLKNDVNLKGNSIVRSKMFDKVVGFS